MKRFAGLYFGVFCVAMVVAASARLVPGQTTAQPASSTVESKSAPPPATYTLTPERREKAIAYSRSLYVLYFIGTLLSIAINLFLWRAGIAARFRDWARRGSQRYFVQCLIFVPLFLVAASLLNLPLEYYSGYIIEHRFGLSTQGVAGWFGDWGKSLGIEAVLGVIVVLIFYWVVRRNPHRWWFYFWLTSIPLVLAYILIEPAVIDPLYYKFTPLTKTQPALVGRIEDMMNHAGISVPPERIFEMNASSRTTAVDAYVTGLGASKRVVVWDTTLKTMRPDELLLVLGHETGHYVLHHIPKEFALDEGVALVFFFLGFVAATRLIEWVGPRTGIEGVGDLASLPLMLVALTLMVFLSAPLVNGISRHYEHQADQFGLEVAYGIVANPNDAEVESLQILGNEDLADPDPNPFIKFWLYTHPPLDDRIRFAAAYHPWAEGKPLKLLPSQK
jgi:STE24 endopeptidase